MNIEANGIEKAKELIKKYQDKGYSDKDIENFLCDCTALAQEEIRDIKLVEEAYKLIRTKTVVKNMKFKRYRKKGITEMRPYVKGEDLSNVYVNKSIVNPMVDMGMIGRNPSDHANQWYMPKKYFLEFYEEE